MAPPQTQKNNSEYLVSQNLPDTIKTEEECEELLSRPPVWLPELLKGVDGDIMFLGIGGKVGPTIARMAKRAVPSKRIIGVARFSEKGLKERLESWGIETIVADLLDQGSVTSLPDVPSIVYMAGKKFGTEDDASFTWAMNTHVPALVAERFKSARMVVFSSICVYPFVSINGGGWDELGNAGGDEKTAEAGPTGDYPSSCVGREKIFTYFSKKYNTPGRLMRLNYAIDMRYGALYDIATMVRTGKPVSVRTAYVSVIWQGDSNAQILGGLAHTTSPTTPLNIGGPEYTSVRMLAHEFGRRFGIEPKFEGDESPFGYHNNSLAAQRLYGYPVVPLARMIDWVADWVQRDMPSSSKPTHFDERGGKY
jgi:nucleoside-diphosphate-sugar epimerase